MKSKNPPKSAHRVTFKRIAVALGAFVLLSASATIIMSFNRPRVTFDPIKRFAQMRPAAKSPDQFAWPAYRDAWVGLGLGPGDPMGRTDGAEAAKSGFLPGSEDWLVAREWVVEHQAQIAALCAASKRPLFGFPIGVAIDDADAAYFGKGWQDSINSQIARDYSDVNDFRAMGIMLPQLATMRAATNILATDMLLAIEQGDGERATRDAQTIIAQSIHVQEDRLLMCDLVAMAIRKVAVNRILCALEWKPAIFTNEQLSRLRFSVLSIPSALERPEFSTEKLMFEDVVQRTFTDDGQGDGRFSPQWSQFLFLDQIRNMSAGSPMGSMGEFLSTQAKLKILLILFKPYAAMAVAGRKETLEHYDQTLKLAEVDWKGTLIEYLESLEKSEGEWLAKMKEQWPRYFLESLLMLPLAKNAIYYQLDRAAREACSISIAAELYHRAHGKWPASAQELAPLCDGKVPLDPWTGKPIAMATDADGFRMWSVGKDGVDNHGNLLNSRSANESPDWVWLAPRGNLERWLQRAP